MKNIKIILLVISVAAFSNGCGTGGKEKAQQREFFTSGSKEADQRASQRMAKEEQLTGEGEGTGEKGVKKAKKKSGSAQGGTEAGAQAEAKLSLFDRLGGEQGVAAIVDDFLQRALEDPRVNWQRHSVKKGGFSIHAGESVTWNDKKDNVDRLKLHMVQFLALATGGPAHYDGKEIKLAHQDMHIQNPEFDAALGDLKATLDKLKVPNKEQKELLSIVESTRPLIVTER